MRWTWMVVAAVAAVGLGAWLLRDSVPTGEAPTGGSLGRCVIVGTVRRLDSPITARVEIKLLRRYGLPTAPDQPPWFIHSPSAARTDGTTVATVDAGPDGRFRADDLAPGDYRVMATAASGERGSASAEVHVDGEVGEANPSIATAAASLHGRLLGAGGRPGHGIVQLFRGTEVYYSDGGNAESGPPLPVDAEGRFVATGLEAGAYLVEAVEDGVQRVRSGPIRVPVVGEYVFDLDRGRAPFRGRVVSDEGGAAIASAVVLASSRGQDPQLAEARTTTGAAGEFELALLGARRLRVYAEGYAPVDLEPEASARDVEVRLVREASLTGRVTLRADGRPVAGAAVHVECRDERGDWRPLVRGPPRVTDEAGRYEIQHLEPKEVAVFALRDDAISEGLEEFAAGGKPTGWTRLESGKSTVLDIAMVGAARARGTVRDAAGSPVAGARIDSYSQSRGKSGRPHVSIEDVATRADGSFEAGPLIPGSEYEFRASAVGCARGKAGPFRASPGKALDVSIDLPAARRIHVTLVDAVRRTPLSGARVLVGAAERGGSIFDPDERSAITDEGGRAHLDGLPPGALGAVVEAEGYAGTEDYESKRLEGSEAGSGELEATLALAPEAVITGQAVLPDGSPAPWIQVGAKRGPPRDGFHSGTRGVPASADGTFRITGLTEGTYTVTAESNSHGVPLRGRLAVSAGATGVVLRLVPAGTDGSILVRALDRDGKPIARGRVSLDVLGTHSHFGWLKDGIANFEGAVDPEGFVSVWGATSKDRSSPPLGAVRRRITRADSNVIEVRLSAERTIGGRVVGPDGRGVPGIDLEAVALREDRTYSGSDDEHGSGRSDEDGVFRIGGLGEGRYRIEAHAPGRFVAGAAVEAAAGDTAAMISLRDAVQVTVRVVDEAGRPVAGAEVMAYTGERPDFVAQLEKTYPGAATTDADGRATLSGLVAGVSHRLKIEPLEERLDLREYTADSWTPHDDTVRLPRSFIVQGVVHDRQGRPVVGAGVSAKMPASERRWAKKRTTAADGSFRIGHFASEDVTLMLTQSEFDVASGGEPRPVKAGGPDVSLELDVGLELAVRIENWPKGLRDGEACLTPLSRVGKTKTFRQRVSEDGRVRFRGLLATDYCVFTIDPMPDGRHSYRTRLRPGESELIARLEPGLAVSGRVVLPEGVRSTTVHLTGPGLDRWVKTKAEGRFELGSVPDGEWEISAAAVVDSQRYEGSRRVKAGGPPVELKLEKR